MEKKTSNNVPDTHDYIGLITVENDAVHRAQCQNATLIHI